jgi:hypothetical protein
MNLHHTTPSVLIFLLLVELNSEEGEYLFICGSEIGITEGLV